MKARTIAILLLWPLICAGGPVVAQSPALLDAHRQYESFKAKGDLAEAARHAKKALDLAEVEFGSDHITIAVLLDNLAQLHYLLGRYRTAEPLFKRALSIIEQVRGPEHPDFAQLLSNLATLYERMDRFAEAEELYRRALDIDERSRAADDPQLASTLNNLAVLYDSQNRYDEAEPLFERALSIKERALGAEHPSFARTLSNLGQLYGNQRRFEEAEKALTRALTIQENQSQHGADLAKTIGFLANLYRQRGRYDKSEQFGKRGLSIIERSLGEDHPAFASALNDLALLYEDLGHYREAEQLYERTTFIKKKLVGLRHPDFARSLTNLAVIYVKQGRYEEAEPLLDHALEVKTAALGPNHPVLSASLVGLAELYVGQGRYDKSEAQQIRASKINERVYGPEHPAFAKSLSNLAGLYEIQGRYDEAEPMYKRSLRIVEAAQGSDAIGVAAILNGLALMYKRQGRLGEVEALYKRSLAIREKVLGPNHPDIAEALNNLAQLHSARNQPQVAAPLASRALAILESAHKSEHPLVATILHNLSVDNYTLGQHEQAEALVLRALTIRKNALGPDHPDFADSLNNLAAQYTGRGHFDLAEPLYRQSLGIYERAFGANHPRVANSLSNLALVFRNTGRMQQSLDHIRRAARIHRARAVQPPSRQTAGRLSEQKSNRHVFLFHVFDTLAKSMSDETKRDTLIAEAFESSQLAVATSTGAAVARMAARFATGDDALAALVRERQDASDLWHKLDAALIKAASQPAKERNSDHEGRLRQDLATAGSKIQNIDDRLADSFPKYTEYSAPQPLPLSELQSLLAADEALLTFLLWNDRGFVFAVRRDRVMAEEITIGESALRAAVANLRRGLDPARVESLDDLPPFDTTLAYALYQKLFSPVAPLLEGTRHVFVVPDGALQSLPLGVLVTASTDTAPNDWKAYGKVPWLARKFAMTTLPSVSSLKALRTFAGRTKAARPFLGVGDPKLEGKTGSGRGVRLASLFTRSGIADVASVRALPSLPDSFDELQTMARSLGAENAELIVGGEATEAKLKAMSLSDFRVLTFATHGLVAGDLAGLAEPALVLTPPRTGTDLDDGLLTAGEVARLKLDADWVILSACNTAAPDGTPGAEGLSGLAKAFFYAGARTLLVSHWPVVSDAAVAITTRMLAEAQKPDVGRAEAHRRAIVALIDGRLKPAYAHPLIWAPFVVVGEGGA